MKAYIITLNRLMLHPLLLYIELFYSLCSV